MQNDPGGNQRSDDDPEGEVVVPFWFIGKQHETSGDGQYKSDDKKGIFSDRIGSQNPLAGKCHILL